MQNQSKREIIFDTQLKTALMMVPFYVQANLRMSRDTRVSYGRRLLIRGYFCTAYDYAGKTDLSKG